MKYLLFNAILVIGLLSMTITADPAASTLYLNKTETIFSINVANDSNDTYFYFESRYRHAWVAIGVGTEMKNSLMFFIYPTKNGSKVTLSPRIASGTIEPSYSKEVGIETMEDFTDSNRMAIGAVCHNCRSWDGGSLDVSSTAQPWMYAFGPNGNPVTSDSPTADLTQHSSYGKFTMDMVQATGFGGLPNATRLISGVTFVGNQYINDGDYISQTHGWVMSALVIISTPLLMLHLLSGVPHRWATYAVFLILLVAGLMTGFWGSTFYNRSKGFHAAHQIVSYPAIALLIASLRFHIISRRQARRSETRRPFLTAETTARIAVVLVLVAWALGLIDGFLGIKLAGTENYIYIAYGCSIIAMILVIAPLILLIKRKHSRNEHVKLQQEAVGIVAAS